MVPPPFAPNMQDEDDNLKLRRAIHKLKVENSRMKSKIKTLTTTVQQLVAASGLAEIKSQAQEAEKDYDEIGRDYLLIGGPKDPLGMRFEVLIKDANGIEHKSCERYYWYKMAEFFNDTDAMAKIKDSDKGNDAENAKKAIKGFNQKKWDEVKMTYWEEAQTLKFEQVRWIQNLLVVTGETYLAIASMDKEVGTGWRKNREQAFKPALWEGDNKGGKWLMNYRQTLKEAHQWMGPNEEQEAKNKFKELHDIWKKSDLNRPFSNDRRSGILAGRGRGGRGRGRGSFGGGGGGRGGNFPRKTGGRDNFSRDNGASNPSPWAGPPGGQGGYGGQPGYSRGMDSGYGGGYSQDPMRGYSYNQDPYRWH